MRLLIRWRKFEGPYRRWFCAYALAIISCSIAGCSEQIDRLPVQGRVLVDGKPLQFGVVMVVPQGARPAMAELDTEGRFELMTYKPGDGTVLGKHKMSVNAGEVLNEVSVRWHAPKKYAGVSSSGLFIDVSPDMDDEVEINLTWDGGKPFVESAKGP